MIKQLSLTLAAVMLLAYVKSSREDMGSSDKNFSSSDKSFASSDKSFASSDRTIRSSSALCWTKWFDRDDASGTGDWESLKDLRNDYPGQICPRPQGIQAVTVHGGIPAENTNQKFYAYNTVQGFICRNVDQKSGCCRDYKVRFRCPCHPMPVSS